MFLVLRNGEPTLWRDGCLWFHNRNATTFESRSQAQKAIRKSQDYQTMKKIPWGNITYQIVRLVGMNGK